jgi:hypothetical protein
MMAAATFRFMQATAKTAMRRVLGIRGGQGETLVPPTAVAGGDEGFVSMRTQLKNERFEVESVISVGDCDQTEILVSTFDNSSDCRLSRYVDASNVQLYANLNSRFEIRDSRNLRHPATTITTAA